ncbi:DNA cytosine methyltransferase [Pseudonocardia cypriaca]|uniref:DNA (cytosine-5-)-methyltransferase n=1 Tax=Pseudonocardia cypriaca TaxID=882449 RepID=A0A543FQL5_9PSEU|nr:DNA cytosine methyltransferase [Pseudonocardia cypriaca]TQM36034.1 DNA (cytosine-5)-methyltransferase 1 [Pseudonocardia cypriaca]
MTVSTTTAQHPLLVRDRPNFEAGAQHLRVVDLFAGCGGLTLGVAQAAHGHGAGLDVVLAVDFVDAAVDVYRDNFPSANVRCASVEDFFDGELGELPTPSEQRTRSLCHDIHLLVGGPPCQGHSDLNNHTRRDDPKNALYVRMARAAELLRPDVVLIENVPAVRRDRKDAVGVTTKHLQQLGYSVASDVIGVHALGVAQTRKRHILLASRDGVLDVDAVLNDVGSKYLDLRCNLRWAIGDLVNVDNPKPYDQVPRASSANRERMEWLLRNNEYDLPNSLRPECHQNDHSYKSMYGRLSWDAPAQTLTSGFGSIGQGRYMHPELPRALTAHEAARIQGFPDYFTFASAKLRAQLADIIGNAVPPALSSAIASRLIPGLLADTSAVA